MTRLTESQLRRIISREAKIALQEATIRRRYSLRTLLEADDKPAEDMPKGLDVSSGPSAVVKWLDGPGADPRVRALLNSGRVDGDPKDEAASVSETGATIGKLIPTQVEIELTKSIGYPLAKFDSLKKMISGGVQRIGPEGNDTIVISGNLIVDGHHRWSSLFSVTGPEGQIAAINIALPETDAASVLAIVQSAIASTLTGGESIPKAKAGGMNILGKGKEAIAELIRSAYESGSGEAGPILTDEFVMQCMKDKAVKKHFGIPDQLASVAGSFGSMKSAETKAESRRLTLDSIVEARGNRATAALQKCREIIINKVASNLSQMKQPADGAPPRVDMPQLDKAKGGAEAVINNLETGRVNYKTPFKIRGKEITPGEPSKEKVADSYMRPGDIVVERWQRLAGIIKG